MRKVLVPLSGLLMFGASFEALAAREVDAKFLLGEPTKELCAFIQSGYRESYDQGMKQINDFVKDKDVGQKKKESIEAMLNSRDYKPPIGEYLVDFLRKYDRMSEGLDWKQLKVLQDRLKYWHFRNSVSHATINIFGPDPSAYGDCPYPYARSEASVNQVHEFLKKGKITFVSTDAAPITAFGVAKRVTRLVMQLDPKAGTATVSIEKSEIELPKQTIFDDYAAERFKQDSLEDCVKILALHPTVDESKRAETDVKPATGAPSEQPKRKWWPRKKSQQAR